MTDLTKLGGEQLRTLARRADRKVGQRIERLRLSDADFRRDLDESLRLDEEIERRRNK